MKIYCRKKQILWCINVVFTDFILITFKVKTRKNIGVSFLLILFALYSFRNRL